ncbi:hypothetical protein X975_10871, partial [Stegodyphus mimosarum]
MPVKDRIATIKRHLSGSQAENEISEDSKRTIPKRRQELLKWNGWG